MSRLSKLFQLTVCAIFVCSFSAVADSQFIEIPKQPQGYVNDYANLIAPQQSAAISNSIR